MYWTLCLCVLLLTTANASKSGSGSGSSSSSGKSSSSQKTNVEKFQEFWWSTQVERVNHPDKGCRAIAREYLEPTVSWNKFGTDEVANNVDDVIELICDRTNPYLGGPIYIKDLDIFQTCSTERWVMLKGTTNVGFYNDPVYTEHFDFEWVSIAYFDDDDDQIYQIQVFPGNEAALAQYLCDGGLAPACPVVQTQKQGFFSNSAMIGKASTQAPSSGANMVVIMVAVVVAALIVAAAVVIIVKKRASYNVLA